MGEVGLQDPRLRREVLPWETRLAGGAGRQDDSAALVRRDGRRPVELGSISVEVADRRHSVCLPLVREAPTAGEVPAIGLGIVSPQLDRPDRRPGRRAIVGARRLDIPFVKRHATAGQGEEGMASPRAGGQFRLHPFSCLFIEIEHPGVIHQVILVVPTKEHEDFVGGIVGQR
jgi:hypothetical protein